VGTRWIRQDGRRADKPTRHHLSRDQVVATVITDTLLTTGWDADSIGYNFKHAVGDDVCVVAGVHSFEYVVTLTGGQSFVTRAFTPDVQEALTS
jgi:hypothetical protein